MKRFECYRLYGEAFCSDGIARFRSGSNYATIDEARNDIRNFIGEEDVDINIFIIREIENIFYDEDGHFVTSSKFSERAEDYFYYIEDGMIKEELFDYRMFDNESDNSEV